MTIKTIEESQYDHETIEKQSRDLWEDSKIHIYNPDDDKEVLSIDTSPP